MFLWMAPFPEQVGGLASEPVLLTADLRTRSLNISRPPEGASPPWMEYLPRSLFKGQTMDALGLHLKTVVTFYINN